MNAATKSTKAWIAGIGGVLLAFLTPLSLVLIDDKTIADITQAQWIVILIGALAGVGVGRATWATPNDPID